MSSTALSTIDPEDVDAAMKVVERIRLEDASVAKDLSSVDRRRVLMEIARDAYAKQGIVVSDDTLERAVSELDGNRHVHVPLAPGPTRTLATAYVRRKRVAAFGAVGLGLAVLLAQVPSAYDEHFVQRPARQAAERQAAVEAAAVEEQARAAERIERAAALTEEALGAARTAEAREIVSLSVASLQRAAESGDHGAFERAERETLALVEQIRTPTTVRIVDRAGERSGVWRTPDGGQTRIFYLVVEAERADGAAMARPVRNVETGAVDTVRTFAIRVPEEVYDRVAEDKVSDGIVDDRDVGTKAAGAFAIDWSVETTGDTITAW